MQDAGFIDASGSPDFLASFFATAKRIRFWLYSEGMHSPLSRSLLRERLSTLVELERLRLAEALTLLGSAAASSPLATQFHLLNPTTRFGLCICVDCGCAVQQHYPDRGVHQVPFYSEESRRCHVCTVVIPGSQMLHRCLGCRLIKCDWCMLSSYYSESRIDDLEVRVSASGGGSASSGGPPAATGGPSSTPRGGAHSSPAASSAAPPSAPAAPRAPGGRPQ